MKQLSILTQIFIIAMIISACGAPQAEPTIDPMELQNTAIAAASTLIAETQAAIPTATLIPPTATIADTPVPTNTFIPLPTQGDASTPNPGGDAATEDPCINKLLPDKLTGNTIKIRVDNPTKGTINLSVYLQSGNPQGVCGYRAYVLEPQDSLVISDLVEGCYSLWAWNPDPKDYFMVTNGTSCLDGSQNWTFDIVPNGGIKLR
ncbi:MAG TPA: hypothetical protein VLA72_06515 [Anaerolineales bacterium]|nr:hypothetical protein [Anaerolineales bacterium]